MQETAVNVRQ